MQQLPDTFSEFLIERFNTPSTIARSGYIAEKIFPTLQQIIFEQINYPIDQLLESKFVSFCYPNSPIIYPQTTSEVKKMWDAGSTMAIQDLQKRSSFLNSVCKKVEDYFKCQLTCSVYVARPDNLTFSAHYDEWEGLALQVKGQKKFTIIDDNTESNIDLYEKNWLKIEPTDLHKAIAIEFSVHANFALHRKYKIDE